MNTILAILSATSISGLPHEYWDLSLCVTPGCSSVPCTIVIVVAAAVENNNVVITDIMYVAIMNTL